MKSVLVFPPVSDPGNPPLGLATLAGFLRAHGETVDLFDLNIRSFHEMLRPATLRHLLGRIQGRFAELDARPHLSSADAAEYLALARSVMWGEQVVGAIEGALEALRSPSTYEARDAYAAASQWVSRAMSLVAAAHYPARWGFRTLDFGITADAAAVLGAADDARVNFFIPFLRECVTDIKRAAPSVVGISVNYFCQLSAGVTVASMVRAAIRNVTIVVGGSLISMFTDRWEALGPFAEVVDAFIPCDGERPLLEVIRRVRKGLPLAGAPGVVVFKNGVPVSGGLDGLDADDGCLLPDFDGLPLERYLAPRRVLPYRTSTGCYWGRCTFCSQHLLNPTGFQKKSVTRIVMELGFLAERHGATDFYFVDEAIPPATAIGLGDEVRGRCLPYTWFGEARFEAAMNPVFIARLAEGGCKMLVFGLESGAAGVLSRMRKGTDLSVAAQVLASCSAVGIRTFVMFFLGFPGETTEDAAQTVAFVEEQDAAITHVAFSSFQLLRGTSLHKDHADFGLSLLVGRAGQDLELHCAYLVRDGISASQAEKAVSSTKERPRIKAMLELPLVTRNHLVHLPPRLEVPSPSRKRRGRIPLDCRPVPRLGLRTIGLSHDLGSVREFLESGPEQGETRSRAPATYLFDIKGEDAMEVGEHGLVLVAQCDGSTPVREILELVGRHNRTVARRFLDGLWAVGMLSAAPGSTPALRSRARAAGK